MKVLYLPLGNQPAAIKAFKETGVELNVFNFSNYGINDANRMLINIVSEFKPDLVHMQLQMTNIINPETILKAKNINKNCIFSNWSGDIRKFPSQSFISMSNVVDYSLMSNVGQINLYKMNGCKNLFYWQVGYDPESFFPKNNTFFEYDAVFVGNAYDLNTFPDVKLRIEILKHLKSVFGNRFGLFGSGYDKLIKSNGSIDPSELNNLYNKSLCTISINNFNDESHYFSDRLLACMASGRPSIIYRFPGIESYFCNNSDCFIAYNQSDFVNYVNLCKKNVDFANSIGRNGERIIRSEHNMTSRIIELYNIVGLL